MNFFSDDPASIVFQDGTRFDMKIIELDQYIEDGHGNNCRRKLLSTNTSVTLTVKGKVTCYQDGKELVRAVEQEMGGFLEGLAGVLVKVGLAAGMTPEEVTAPFG